jgi:hypothetical protein
MAVTGAIRRLTEAEGAGDKKAADTNTTVAFGSPLNDLVSTTYIE